jgi:hypothetical protein
VLSTTSLETMKKFSKKMELSLMVLVAMNSLQASSSTLEFTHPFSQFRGFGLGRELKVASKCSRQSGSHFVKT